MKDQFSVTQSFFFLNLVYILFIYFYDCVGSLSFRVRAFSSCGKWGPLFIAVRGPLFIAVRGPFTIAAPPVAGHRLQTRRLSSCGSRAQLLRGMWDPPRPGLEPASPALAGRFSATAPPGKPPTQSFLWHIYAFGCMLCHKSKRVIFQKVDPDINMGPFLIPFNSLDLLVQIQ